MVGLLVTGILIVVLGLGFWWLLTNLFWRRHFPTQSPPPPMNLPDGPPSPPRSAVGVEDRGVELRRRLDELERALIEGRISEETYRGLKEKYEGELKDL
jgi:hypothetical protein